MDTPIVTQHIRDGIPIRFAKFGDGEFECARGATGNNCDGDVYFPELGQQIQKSFVELAVAPNTYLGHWNIWDDVPNFFNTLYTQKTGLPSSDVPWVSYGLLLKDITRAHLPYMYDLVEAIQVSPRNKIYVCNDMNAKMCSVFRSKHLSIPPRCWFLEYDHIMNLLKEMCKEHPDSIVLLSAGLCSKVAIADLVRTFPTITCLDFGSGFDCLCRGYMTRSYQGKFEVDLAYYKGLLPADF